MIYHMYTVSRSLDHDPDHCITGFIKINSRSLLLQILYYASHNLLLKTL